MFCKLLFAPTCFRLLTSLAIKLCYFVRAVFVASAGTSGAAKAGTSAGRAANFAALIKDVEKIMDAKGLAELPSDTANVVINWATYDYNSLEEEDIARMSAEIIALFDPTGVSSIVA